MVFIPRSFKMLVFVLAVTFSFFGLSAASESKKLGVGLSLGQPTGINAKLWLSNKNALDATLGWGYWNTWIKVDYLWHKWDIIDETEDFKAPLYYGVGGFAGGLKDDAGIGAEGVVGLNILLKKAPVDFFVQAGPAVQLVKDGGIYLHAAIGARYYFNLKGEGAAGK